VEKAVAGDYDHWAEEPYGLIVLMILLDQFSRNIYRKQAKAFAGDQKACELCKAALDKGWWFIYSHLER